MPLYEITDDAFRPLTEASFADIKMRERDDLQRLLRTQIEVLDEDLYVLAEEFNDWEDSNRRIDLLAIDRQANLVVIELKTTKDGGHMELQAIRYAGMVSAMTFERAVQIHGQFLSRLGASADESESKILSFLGWDEPDEETFGEDVRIILVSEDFGKELTTAVLWLCERDLDIRCVRLRPYRDGDTTLMDVQQIIPLPEVNEYQVQLREKEQVGRKKKAARGEIYLRFWDGVIAIARRRKTRHENIKPGRYHYLGASSGVRGLGFNFLITQWETAIELYIDRGEATDNKNIFDQLVRERTNVEDLFGGELQWQRLDDKRACRIKYVVRDRGYKSPEEQWPEVQEEMVDAMSKFDAALKQELDGLELQ